MADLISRAALLGRFKALQEYDPEHEGRGWACNFLNDSREPSTEWYCVEDVVEDMPAVDAAPVVHGYWLEETDRYRHWHCSNCGKVQGITCIAMKYCPECGAKMDRRDGDAFGGR